MILSRAQRVAIKRVYDRSPDNQTSYYDFRRRVKQGYDCVMLYWCGMWLGIEKDGYTHS